MKKITERKKTMPVTFEKIKLSQHNQCIFVQFGKFLERKVENGCAKPESFHIVHFPNDRKLTQYKKIMEKELILEHGKITRWSESCYFSLGPNNKIKFIRTKGYLKIIFDNKSFCVFSKRRPSNAKFYLSLVRKPYYPDSEQLRLDFTDLVIADSSSIDRTQSVSSRLSKKSQFSAVEADYTSCSSISQDLEDLKPIRHEEINEILVDDGTVTPSYNTYIDQFSTLVDLDPDIYNLSFTL